MQYRREELLGKVHAILDGGRFDHLRLYRDLIRQALAAPDAPILDDSPGE